MFFFKSVVFSLRYHTAIVHVNGISDTYFLDVLLITVLNLSHCVYPWYFKTNKMK